MWKLITYVATVVGLVASVLGILTFVHVRTPVSPADVPEVAGSPCSDVVAPHAPASVNGVPISLPTAGSCMREPFYDDTDGSVWKRYRLVLTTGWAAFSTSWKAVAQREGGLSTTFECVPVLRINGPFKGTVDLLDGGIRIVPVEWADSMATRVLGMQAALVPLSKEPCVRMLVYDG